MAFVVKTQAEDMETMLRLLQNGAVNNFLSADLVGKIYAVLLKNRRLKTLLRATTARDLVANVLGISHSASRPCVAVRA